MKFEKEFIEETGLSEDQVKKVNEKIDAHVAEEKKAWDGKANTDAEAIIQGAVNLTIDKMGLEGIQRKDGEKMADFLMRTTPMFIDSALAKEKSEVIRLKAEYKEKLKTGGDENVKKELTEAIAKLDLLQQKEAQFKDYEENDYKGKYENLTNELNIQKIENAFNSVKPIFPDTVNVYEAKGRWDEFKKDVLEKNNIDFDKEEPIAINKENKHMITKLKDLVGQNKEITELSKGREAKGIGSDSKNEIEIENVPFKVPKEVTPAERAKLIKEYLVGTKKMDVLSPEYSKEYKKLNDLILKKN